MTLHFRTLGAGPPVLILHGLFGSSDNWQTFALRLAGQGYTVILPDLRNHGRSPHATTHTYAALAADVLALIENAHLKNPVLIGHSMGGKTAMQAALDSPASIAKIVVVDIAPGAYRESNAGIVEALAGMDIDRISNRNEADAALAAQIPETGTRQFLLKNLFRDEAGRFRWRFNLDALRSEIGHMSAAVQSAQPYSGPALFIRGERSGYVKERRTQEIRRLFPAASIVTAPGAGHWVHVDAPDWLLRTVLTFLNS